MITMIKYYDDRTYDTVITIETFQMADLST